LAWLGYANKKEMKILKKIIDSPYFTGVCFVVGGLLGLANSTGFFSQLGDLSNIEAFSVFLNTLSFALVGAFAAKWIRENV